MLHLKFRADPVTNLTTQMPPAWVHPFDVLAYLGFGRDIMWPILQYWIVLTTQSSGGGAYELIGVALAALAEIGEPPYGHRSVHGDKETREVRRLEWKFLFAQVLSEDMLRHVGMAGVYSAPTFSKAKWLVSRIIRERWDSLLGERS